MQPDRQQPPPSTTVLAHSCSPCASHSTMASTHVAAELSIQVRGAKVCRRSRAGRSGSDEECVHVEAPRAAGARPRGTGGPHAARLVDRATLGAAPALRRPLAAPENACVNKSVQMARTRRLEVRGDPITAMSGCSNFAARLVGVKLRDKLPSHG